MPLIKGKSEESFNRNVGTEREAGKPLKQSLAIAYSMKRKAEAEHKAYGGKMGDDMNCPDCKSGHCGIHKAEMMAEGGDVVDRAMKRYMSEGGRVANQEHGPDDEDLAGFSPNEFDDLVLRDDLEQHYTGENSGDELGNMKEEQDDRDIVSRIMKARQMKDRMPIAGYGSSYGKYK